MVFGDRLRRGEAEARSAGAKPAAPIAFTYRDPGVLEVVYAARPGAPASYGVTDETGARHPLAAERRGQAALAGLNLLDAPRRGGPAWKLTGGGRDARVGVNFGEAWSIPELDTWYARTTGEAVTVLWFIDPAGGATPVTPGASYRFELLAATHRCRAELLLQLLGPQGELIEELSRPVAGEARGGRGREGYDAVTAEFEAPQGAAGLAIGVRKGGSLGGEDSFLFVADPRLAPAADGEAALELPAEAVGRAKQALRERLTVERAALPLPEALTDGAPHEVSLLLEAGAGLQEARGIRFQSRPAPAAEAAPEPQVVVSPLRATLAHNRSGDAEGRQLAAYRAWMARAEAGEPLPDLDRLSRALEAGRTGRAELFELNFPQGAAGAVRVLLRGAADLETLWLSLAGLLFAANRTPMEVAVAGAEEAGAAGLRELAKGVRVLGDDGWEGDALHLVLLEPGWEPVAGWLDELRAVFDNFEGVGAAGPKLIELDGRMASAGAFVGRKGEVELLGRGGNPRDPRFGFVRPVDVARPLMVSREAWAASGGFDGAFADAALAEADLALRLRQAGRRVLYAPTAEMWRLKGCEAPEPPVAAELTAFKGRWAPVFAAPAMRERHAALRVLFVDQEAPTIDMDAGGYAAFQEMRMLQAAGAKVDFLPKNLAWMDRHTIALERAGVECHYAPFVKGFDAFLRAQDQDYDLLFVVRHKVARLVQEALADLPERPKLVLNLADLHFLREAREATAGTPGFTVERAAATREAELAAIAAADLTLTYSEVEAAVVESHTLGQAKVALAPWVVETREAPIGTFEGTDGLMFLGGFGHPPNAEAVKRFAAEVMPDLAERLPQVRLKVVGSKPPPEVLGLEAPNISVLGYVADLDEVFASARVFVAPLAAGAGLKGKVIEALARGVPAVLSPVAAEGTGLAHGHDCLVAHTPAEWLDAIEALTRDRELWERLARNSLETARRRFSFESGAERMREALALIGVHSPSRPALVYRLARPDSHGGASAAPAVLRLP
ncbi:MAG TPA: glycosyltransferase [Caulobacteraceae bacterium]